MQILSGQKRAAQAGGLLVMLVGAVPLLYGMLELTGVISTYWGPKGRSPWFFPSVFLTVGLGALAVWAGRRLVSWGLRP